MKCPNCEMELREGTLYCEQCGQDIHIVPDFEPEVEITIEESLGKVLENAFESQKPEERDGRKKRFSGFNVAVMILIIISLFFLGFAFYFSKAFLCLAEKGVTGSER